MVRLTGYIGRLQLCAHQKLHSAVRIRRATAHPRTTQACAAALAAEAELKFPPWACCARPLAARHCVSHAVNKSPLFAAFALLVFAHAGHAAADAPATPLTPEQILKKVTFPP